MSLFQQARQSKHLPPWLPDGHVSDLSVTTVEVCSHALGAAPSTLAPDNLMIMLAGTAAGSGKYGRSCVGIQCCVSGVSLATSKILAMCS